MKGRSIFYSESELDWIEQRRTLPRSELHYLFCRRFDRRDVSQANLTALCKRRGWMTGRSGTFEKGQTPHNKGKPMPSHPNSRRTQFAPGTVPPNRLPLWSERVGKDGYIEIKVPIKNPYTGHRTRYMHKHRYLWEQVHGPLPEGMCLKALDGDKTNTDPANWEALPRALLPRLNGRYGRDYDAAPDDLKPALMAITKLEHLAREATAHRPTARTGKGSSA